MPYRALGNSALPGSSSGDVLCLQIIAKAVWVHPGMPAQLSSKFGDCQSIINFIAAAVVDFAYMLPACTLMQH
jgi:hypothetical protein